jgi:hypothetical protein
MSQTHPSQLKLTISNLTNWEPKVIPGVFTQWQIRYCSLPIHCFDQTFQHFGFDFVWLHSASFLIFIDAFDDGYMNLNHDEVSSCTLKTLAVSLQWLAEKGVEKGPIIKPQFME